MLALDTAAQTQLGAAVRGVVWLVQLDFGSGALRYTTHPVDVVSGGYTWTGYGQVVGVDGLREAEDGGTTDVALSCSIVSSAMLAALSGNVENYRGRRARLSLQLLGEGYQPVGAPKERWAGYMNKVTVERTPGRDGSATGTVKMVCSRSGAGRARQGTGLRHTHAQHVARWPGDNGCEYIQTLIEKPAVWLSKRFQER